MVLQEVALKTAVIAGFWAETRNEIKTGGNHVRPQETRK